MPEGTVTGLVQILLDHGALVNLRDQEGNTTLHYAVNAELPDVVQQLIKAGVDLDARNIEGKTGSDIAINHYKMLRYLREGNSYSTTQKMMVRFFDASARRMGRVKKSLPEIPE
ncbi:putative ankyrin repeat protein [Phaeoacremonium minimum UCRPA7]|uniref:Putative ankyrin repeat protein n=1 Tax=Phaeoacremonium minimum (strain UCR-PA7) TaxID=1286976 RepID=R8BNA4_PHAM7|nr:putative ankyrin repeat protein [Phaeoacremonium minimum UCRPA7]EOO00817.1 putative ankyrin repeat protein [Phaeoacremonium minimum UCRPA7]